MKLKHAMSRSRLVVRTSLGMFRFFNKLLSHFVLPTLSNSVGGLYLANSCEVTLESEVEAEYTVGQHAWECCTVLALIFSTFIIFYIKLNTNM